MCVLEFHLLLAKNPDTKVIHASRSFNLLYYINGHRAAIIYKSVFYSSKTRHHFQSSSGSSLTSWLTPGQVYEKSREDPEIGSVYWFIGLLVMFYVVQANTMSQQDHNYSFYIM